jgi:INO80 complex subunit B
MKGVWINVKKILKTCGMSAAVMNTTSSPKATTKKKIPKSNKGKDSGTSSEEERWLDAIESGKLEEVDDELKKKLNQRIPNL